MYEHGTPHYNLPQTVGTDKRDWFDTNEAFAEVDSALYTAAETASSTASGLSGLSETVTGIQEDVTDIQQDVADIDGRVTQQGSAITGLTTRVDDVKADALDMICAVDEGTAQVATVAVSEGDYFRYNDVLYMATTNIAVGDTIVPNTNCRATNVATELASIEDVSDMGTTVDVLTGLPTSGNQTVTSMSNYRYIVAELRFSSDAEGISTMIPIDYFAKGNRQTIAFYDSTNSVTHTFNFKYIDDTTIAIGYNLATSIYIGFVK